MYDLTLDLPGLPQTFGRSNVSHGLSLSLCIYYIFFINHIFFSTSLFNPNAHSKCTTLDLSNRHHFYYLQLWEEHSEATLPNFKITVTTILKVWNELVSLTIQ